MGGRGWIIYESGRTVCSELRRLKPIFFADYGTAEAMPFQNPAYGTTEVVPFPSLHGG
jgi:hypothetical protein